MEAYLFGKKHSNIIAAKFTQSIQHLEFNFWKKKKRRRNFENLSSKKLGKAKGSHCNKK